MASVTETMPETGWWDCPDANLYHADRTAVSHSALECFRQSVALYHGRYITGTIPHPEPTPAMRLGTAAHSLILEFDLFEANYQVVKLADGRTKEGKAQRQALKEDSRSVITPEEWDTCHGMFFSVNRHPEARELLDEKDGRNECSIRWTCPTTGMPCKARYDRLLPGKVINLKTAADPSPEAFSRACHNLGYGRAAAMYLDGLWHGAKQEAEHLWIVVGSSPPHDVCVYRASEAMLRQGREEYLCDLSRLAKCHRENRWPSHWPGIQTIDLPRWAQTREAS